MRISNLNTNDQRYDTTGCSGVLRTILPPPLLEHLRHGQIFKFASNIPGWTWWQAMSAREKDEQK